MVGPAMLLPGMKMSAPSMPLIRAPLLMAVEALAAAVAGCPPMVANKVSAVEEAVVLKNGSTFLL